MTAAVHIWKSFHFLSEAENQKAAKSKQHNLCKHMENFWLCTCHHWGMLGMEGEEEEEGAKRRGESWKMPRSVRRPPELSEEMLRTHRCSAAWRRGQRSEWVGGAEWKLFDTERIMIAVCVTNVNEVWSQNNADTLQRGRGGQLLFTEEGSFSLSSGFIRTRSSF